MTVTFVNQAMELINLVLKLITTKLVVVNRLNRTSSIKTRLPMVNGLVTIGICSCSKPLTKGSKELVSLLFHCVLASCASS